MIKKSPKNRRVIVLLIAIIIFFVFMVNMIVMNKSNNIEFKQTVSLEIVEKKNILEKIFVNNSGDSYQVNNVDAITIYNTVMIPMEQVFEGLFEDSYKAGTNQELTYNSMKLNINIDDNRITVPQIENKEGAEIDNTVEVEIEEINGVKYIPLYLISNLPNVRVKIDGKIIYQNSNYISSIEAFNNAQSSHEIKIETNVNEKEEVFDYEGQKLGALWREEALKRIDKYRKKDTNIVVKNQNGAILNNVTVDIRMTNNEFKFGTAAGYLSNSVITNDLFKIISAQGAFKWKRISEYGYDEAKEVISFASDRNMEVRGHCLWWDYVCSTELTQLVGEKDNLQEGTMAYVYNQFINGEITREEAEKFSDEIQKKFENLVLDHIEEEVRAFPSINEWDVVNEILTQQYFKYYLYDRKFLTTNGTFLDTTNKVLASYVDNENYYQFLAKCFDKVREIKDESKLVLNDNVISGFANSSILSYDVNATKNILKYTDNIDMLGVQHHVNNNYNGSPQSYYNTINKVLEQTNIKEVAITEYDNYIDSKIGSYTHEEKETKANYLRDSLIMAYSNSNINEFVFWLYASDHFEDEEREAYEELMQDWLNYKTTLTTNDIDGCLTRLYKGEYTAEIKFNDKEQTVNFTVLDDSDNTVEVIFESNLEKIDMSQLPSKTSYYQSVDKLILDGGKINAYYEDGTIQQIDLLDPSIKVTGYNNSIIGKQTLTVTYNNKQTTFEIEVVESFIDKRVNQLNNIKNSNEKIKNDNIKIYSNISILNKYNEVINSINLQLNKVENDNLEEINNIYQKEIDMLDEIINQYSSSNIEVQNEENLKELIKDITNILEQFKVLYYYYEIVDNIDIITEVQEPVNNLINKYNSNLDVDLSLITDFIDEEKELYQGLEQEENLTEKYLNKQRLIKVSPILAKIIDKKVEDFKEEEKLKLQLVYDKDINTLTNQSVTVTLKHGTSTLILNNNGSNDYIFTENGIFDFEVSIKGEIYKITAQVTNVDKMLPKIEGVEEGYLYYVEQQIVPKISDTNLKEVTLYINDLQVEYKVGQKLTEEGFYKIIATDKAGNTQTVQFKVMERANENYQIQENNVITNIQVGTKLSEFKENAKMKTEYTIKHNEKELNPNEKISTGDILETEDGQVYTLVVAGDINKDGEVTIKDIVKLRRYLLGDQELGEVEKIAADANLDSKEIGIRDLVRIRILALSRK